MNSTPEHSEQLATFQTATALIFTEKGIMVEELTHEVMLPWFLLSQRLPFTIQYAHLDGQNLILKVDCRLPEIELSKRGYRILPIRAVLNEAIPAIQHKVFRAYQWLNWDSHSRYCGKCSAQLKSEFNSLEKRCDRCGIVLFPKASPAVMVLLHRKNELLLARSPHFQPGVYSAIAGFVEIGESAEQAAKRETFEELGLEISNLRYFSSQTWPFPDSFMIAFTSSDPQGELILDSTEIEDAKWFNLRNLPTLPSKASISRRLIESTVKELLD